MSNETSVRPRSNATDRLDTVFGLLSDQRRRYLLYYLSAVEGNVVEFSAAVEGVREYETGDSGTSDGGMGNDGTSDGGTGNSEMDDAAETRADGGSQDEIATALSHNHLPRLADAEVLDYDQRQGTIRLTEEPSFEEWVEHTLATELE